MIKKIMLSLITFIILVTIVFYAFDLIINTTKSMPIGIYQNTKNQIITKDDIVTFTYHNTNFLKRVIASAGDHIEIIDNIKVNGQILPNSQVFKFDRNNNTLPIVNLKKFLNDDEILVMGEHIKSFDSRYLGVINVSETKAKKVKPILTWSVK